ncbi:MAG TPA: LysE family translocator [Nitrospirota bacterium]|nr:LysE family translocator [Nitrospirota bacterium]
MTFQTWLAFTAAAGIILVIPGPTILAVISHSLAHGRKAVLPLVAGVTLGDFTALSCSLLGLGALLAASAALFSVLKLAGAVYLVYLGVKLWRSGSAEAESPNPERTSGRRSLFLDLFVITSLNPKSIAFFVAFLPQFVSPAEPVLPQLLILGVTFLVLAMINATIYAVFAGRLRESVNQARHRRWFSRIGGAVLISAGVITAAVKRS